MEVERCSGRFASSELSRATAAKPTWFQAVDPTISESTPTDPAAERSADQARKGSATVAANSSIRGRNREPTGKSARLRGRTDLDARPQSCLKQPLPRPKFCADSPSAHSRHTRHGQRSESTTHPRTTAQVPRESRANWRFCSTCLELDAVRIKRISQPNRKYRGVFAESQQRFLKSVRCLTFAQLSSLQCYDQRLLSQYRSQTYRS